MLAMFQIARPGPDAAQAITAQWLDTSASISVRCTALLLLGAHALNSQEQCKELLAQEERAVADGLLDTYLAALGNAHLYESVQRYLLDEDPRVRATAKLVLGWK